MVMGRWPKSHGDTEVLMCYFRVGDGAPAPAPAKKAASKTSTPSKSSGKGFYPCFQLEIVLFFSTSSS